MQGAFRYVHADAAGEEHVVGYAFAGEFVGDYISMCVDAPSQVTIGAMCGSEALLVPGERLETFYRTDAACERLAAGWPNTCWPRFTNACWTAMPPRRSNATRP